MANKKSVDSDRTTILLRFRDMVTEPRGNIAEHARLIDEYGFAWWGWWARNQELAPKSILSSIFNGTGKEIDLILFDTGLMECYKTRCSKVVVAPGDEGIGSPDFRATPHYYVRGRYPAWFRLHNSIAAIECTSFKVMSRPTLPSAGSEKYKKDTTISLDMLRDERPTLWLVQYEQSNA
ncbi:hypothetical protein [Hoeflea poritis]|uniref:Pua-like domain-containing protein n=1 Tax=Hoeflea poritis TaxID=2993659 RepID=A0ABT4VKK6_9HYPH|nr:hypothetical protein [Hoeflea poritis]MDA4845251.1 hypothetical protein [Hoeflea poritis]